MWSLVTLLLLLASVTAGNYPQLEVSTLMRILLVPVDTGVGSAIYRLRGADSDFDYPLQFDVVGSTESVVEIENLPCTRNQSFCEANVKLARSLELGRVYDLKVRVRDTNGDTTTVLCTIKPTNSSTPIDTIFPHLPTLVVVPENTKLGTELEYVIARKNPKNSRHANLELRGSPLFSIKQSLASPETVNGTVVLSGELDFETQAMYTLSVFAVDAYAEPENDTRNLACFTLAVAVLDVQDMPPVFTRVPPVTLLNNTLKEGDVILTVHAEDGDKGFPRQIRYGLVSENHPFTPFFHMDDKTGNLSLARPLKNLRLITSPHQPILLTIIAEEVKTGLYEPPAMSTTAQLALIMGELDNTPPYFENDNYVAHIEENSPQGTALLFGNPYITEIRDDDLGKNGVFKISLVNDNGTFEISPQVAEKRTNFVIRVRNNILLDYEKRQSVIFTIVAQEVGPKGHLSSSAQVTVYLKDINDNPPVFREQVYRARLPENVTAGFLVATVHATDADSGVFAEVAYTRIYGNLNDSLSIDARTGEIKVQSNRHGFDREYAKEYQFYVEAADMRGDGNKATVPLVIQVDDVNDNIPRFEKTEYVFVLSKDLLSLSESPAIVRAIDDDAEPPNNVVRYEILDGNRGNLFSLNPTTGLLTVTNRAYSNKLRRNDEPLQKFELNIRAYDNGIPSKSTVVLVNIYPPEQNARNMTFIISGYTDEKEAEELLSKVTGGRVKIRDIQPMSPRRSRRDTSEPKYIVSARVLYDDNPTVDLTDLQKTFRENMTVITAPPVTAPVPVEKYQRAESALFWILMILALLIIIIIILLLLCCVCPGCPLYVNPKNTKQVEPESEETVQLVVKEQGPGMETKGVQAVVWSGGRRRREAWSAEHRERRHPSWRFNRRNVPTKEYEDYEFQVPTPAAATLDRHSPHSLPAQRPTVIYTRELQDLQRHADAMYVEDVDTGDFHVIDHRQPTRGPHREEDTDSMRRHEVERGSDLGRGAEYHFVLHRPPPQDEEDPGLPLHREQFYIREGNAEILRLVTRGRTGDEEEQPQQRPMTLVPPRQQGKDILMQRFMEDQRNSTGEQEAQEQLVRRLLEEETRINNALLHVAQRQGHEEEQIETQSLPGHASMATQTDVDSSTQTEPMHLMRPPRRRARSDNDDSYTEEEVPSTGDLERKHRSKRKRNSFYRVRRPGGRMGLSVPGRRHKIKTPILEETESALEAAERQASAAYVENKSSLLRRRNSLAKIATSSGEMDVSRMSEPQEEDTPTDSLEERSPSKRKYAHAPLSTSLLDVRRHVEFRDSDSDRRQMIASSYPASSDTSRGRSSIPGGSRHRHRSLSNEKTDRLSSRRHSLSDPGQDLYLKQTIASRAKSLNQVNSLGKSGSVMKRGPRYMEWYKSKKEDRERRKREQEEAKRERQRKKSKAAADREAEVQRELDKADEQILKVTVFDDDMDSGIVMASLQPGGKKKRSTHLLEKKSVFTIAYDDMQTKQLRPESSSPKY